MSAFRAPVKEMRFVMDSVCGLADLQKIETFAEASGDLVDAVLDEAGKLAAGILDPLNLPGDQAGSVLENGVVRAPDGFAEAYRAYVEGGWNGLAVAEEHGGQGLPFLLMAGVQEMFTSANMSWALCPMLTHGAVKAMTAHASDELKAIYLAKLVSGEWTGTMNLTEPQAGSDVGALKSTATPRGDGSYSIRGTKIFITWGEHEMAENIIHLVLARTPGAPEGSKGISMFLVPKFLVNADATIGARNDLKCVSLEHKLGIHASPTCVMSFGDNDDCAGWLVGVENQGMRNMFTMMNHARINVGLQGVAIAERATQRAVAYAFERVQGVPAGAGGPAPGPIAGHADVRRMLMTMRVLTEAARALTYLNASAVDRGHAHPDQEVRRRWAGLADLLTPVTKAFATDMGVEVASLGVQVHGGMGFIEETGAAQHYRDARIAPIYEGTNGIQALDLVGRKLNQDGGAHWRHFFREIGLFTEALPAKGALSSVKPHLQDAMIALHNAAEWLTGEGAGSPRAVQAGATPFARMFGITVGGYLLAREAVEAESRLDAGDSDGDFLNGKIASARFYAANILPQAAALHAAVTAGDEAMFAISDDLLRG